MKIVILGEYHFVIQHIVGFRKYVDEVREYNSTNVSYKRNMMSVLTERFEVSMEDASCMHYASLMLAFK